MPVVSLPIDMDEVGKSLKEMRLEKEMTLKVIAEKTGTPYQSWQKIENGKRSPSFTLVAKYVSALGFNHIKLI